MDKVTVTGTVIKVHELHHPNWMKLSFLVQADDGKLYHGKINAVGSECTVGSRVKFAGRVRCQDTYQGYGQCTVLKNVQIALA